MSNTIVLEQIFSGTDAKQASEPTAGQRQRIYILPTRQGIIFAILLFSMLMGAVNYNNSMAYILTFMLGSLYILTTLHTYRNLAGLNISSLKPDPVFAGETAMFPILFDNRNKQARPSVNLQLSSGNWSLWRSTPDMNTTIVINVEGNNFCRTAIPVITKHRGLIPLKRISITSYFPLGIFRAWSYLDFNRNCLVYPHPAGETTLPRRALVTQTGEHGRSSGVDDFAGFRRYQQRDSFKNIAWKAVARGQELLVKKFSGNESVKIILHWQDVQHLTTIEQQLSQLCLWILEAEKLQIKYKLELPGDSTESGSGEIHMHNCLEKLARFGNTR